jgi:hypothetical protein
LGFRRNKENGNLAFKVYLRFRRKRNKGNCNVIEKVSETKDYKDHAKHKEQSLTPSEQNFLLAFRILS